MKHHRFQVNTYLPQIYSDETPQISGETLTYHRFTQMKRRRFQVKHLPQIYSDETPQISGKTLTYHRLRQMKHHRFQVKHHRFTQMKHNACFIRQNRHAVCIPPAVFCNKRAGWRCGIVVDLYPVGSRFESRLGCRLSWLMFSIDTSGEFPDSNSN
jgi:hypothetical protein